MVGALRDFQLEELLLTGSPRLTDADVVPLLRSLPRLRALGLSGPGLTDATAEAAAGLPGLTLIGLEDSRVTDAGVRKLAALPGLEMVMLAGCRGVTDAGLDDLAKCPGLVGLDVRGTGVTRAGLRKLATKRPGCDISWDGGKINISRGQHP